MTAALPSETGSGRVALAGRVLKLSALREDPGPYAATFSRARAEIGHGQCLCRTPPLRLVIRCTRAGRWHLAGWPGDGESHSQTCPFYKTPPELTGRGGYTTGAITVTETGTAIRVDQPLRLRLAPGEGATEAAQTEARRSTGTVSLLGLLHWLWEEARLHQWAPGWHRSWGTCRTRLSEVVSACRVNGEDLDDVLHIAPAPGRVPPREQAAFTAFTGWLGADGTTARRGLLLGTVKTLAPTAYGERINLGGLARPLFASTALMRRLRRSYRPVFSGAASPAARRLVLALIERSTSGYLTVVDAAAMLTTATFVPADSSHEVTMAEHLAAARRRFVKPLRYDSSEAVFPDFVLLDDEPYTVVEVYGIHGRESYERRKRAKQGYYRARSIPLLEWDVTGPLPNLARTPRPAAPARAGGSPPGERTR
jgi:hypothetical protein